MTEMNEETRGNETDVTVDQLRERLTREPPKDVRWQVVYGNDMGDPAHSGITHADRGTRVELGNPDDVSRSVVYVARRGEMPDLCLGHPVCPFEVDDDDVPTKYCNCMAGYVQREIHRRAEDEALRLNRVDARLGKWVEESEHVHHYFEDAREADDDRGRVVLLGDALVERGRAKVFGGGLWYGTTLVGDGVSETGNFHYLEDAKKWIEERIAERSKQV